MKTLFEQKEISDLNIGDIITFKIPYFDTFFYLKGEILSFEGNIINIKYKFDDIILKTQIYTDSIVKNKN